MGHGKPAIPNRALLVRCLVGVKQRVDRAAARGVRRHLPTQLVSLLRHLDQVFTWYGKHASIVWIVISVDSGVHPVRLAEVCGTDQDAAIGYGFQRSDAKPLISVSGYPRDASDLVAPLLDRALRVDHVRDVAADGQLVLVAQLPIDAKALGRLATVDGAGDAHRVVALLHLLEALDAVLMSRLPALAHAGEKLRGAQDQAGR